MTRYDLEASTETLGQAECEALLAQGTMGRVAFVVGDYPTILPVNYALYDGLVVFRTDAGAKLSNIPMSSVAFEIDGRDGSTSAWSVMVQGRAREVTTALGDRYDALRRLEITVLAPGDKTHWVAIEIVHLSGRCIALRGAETDSADAPQVEHSPGSRER